MQRINLWPNPDFVPTGMHVNTFGKDISRYMTDGRFSNTSSGYIGLPFKNCEVGTGYVCCFNITSTTATNNIAVFSGDRFWRPASQNVGAQTIRFTDVASDTRIAVPSNMTIDSLIVETDATYDSGVGGASGLLHRGHHATRLRRFVGRVMSDDGDELALASESGHQTRNMEHGASHRERGRNPNLPCAESLWHFESFFENVRRHVQSWHDHLRRQVQGTARKPRRLWRHRRTQRRKGWCLGVQALHGELLESVFQRAKRRADPDRVGDLHARRLGEIAVNGSDVVRRGQHADRLTLMGVMA